MLEKVLGIALFLYVTPSDNVLAVRIGKKYRAFKDRQVQRRKALGAFLAILIIEIFALALIGYNTVWVRNYGVAVVPFSFLLCFLYLISQSWAHEWYETDVFVKMYEAFQLLGLYSNKDEGSWFYVRKGANKVKGAMKSLRKWSNSVGGESSKLAKKELVEPLRNLEENLGTRILPRIAQNKDIGNMIPVLRGIAKLFSEAQKPISLDAIVSKNKDLERYESIELEESPTQLRIILSKEPVKLACSFLLSFFVVTIAVLIHWQLFQTDLLDLISSLTNFLQMLTVGIALGVGFYAVLRRKP